MYGPFALLSEYMLTTSNEKQLEGHDQAHIRYLTDKVLSYVRRQ